MLRATATKKKQEKVPSIVDQALSRTDFIGFMSTTAAPIANLATSKPGSLPRKIMEKTMGIASQRILPTYSSERFSTWFKKRQKPAGSEEKHKPVVLFQTCLVEYQDPSIGKDTVKVLERNGVPVEIAEGSVCCGLPWLDAGNIDNFNAQAEKNAKLLARYVREGKQVIIPQPSCGYTVKKDYPMYIGSEDAKLVGANTFDIAEYLMRIHRREGGIDTEFGGKVEESIAWHVPCHLRAQQIGHASKQLMELTGAKVTAIERCSGIDGTWGLRAKNYEMAKKVAQPLKNQIQQSGCNCVAGDCHLANGAILEETGSTAKHPIQVLARAYGIPEEKS
jgi:Fe-S oxidoreductase